MFIPIQENITGHVATFAHLPLILINEGRLQIGCVAVKVIPPQLLSDDSESDILCDHTLA